MLSAVKAEMAVFQSTGKRGCCLEAVYYRYLLTVPATSVEGERAFSTARLMCTKVRSRLDDSSVDTLCFPGLPVIPRESREWVYPCPNSREWKNPAGISGGRGNLLKLR